MLEYVILGLLFFFLVPGILLSLPQGGSKYMVALVHTVVFLTLFILVQYVSGDLSEGPVEGFAFFMNSSNPRLNSSQFAPIKKRR